MVKFGFYRLSLTFGGTLEAHVEFLPGTCEDSGSVEYDELAYTKKT